MVKVRIVETVCTNCNHHKYYHFVTVQQLADWAAYETYAAQSESPLQRFTEPPKRCRVPECDCGEYTP